MFLSYVYSVKNRFTNQFYFGSRSRNIILKRDPEDDFWIYYFTSSKKVKDLISKYGKDSFDIKILHKDESYDICYWMEQDLILENIKNPLLLNMHYVDKSNGQRKFSTHGKSLSNDTREKISLSHKIRDIDKEHARIERQKMTKSNRTPEEQRLHSEKISRGRNLMSEEAKAERIRKQSESLRIYHQNRRLSKLDK